MSANIDIVKALYQSFRDGDPDATRRVLAPDATWVQMAGFPGGGVHTGPDGVWSGVIERLSELWASWRGEFNEFFDAGEDRVLVLGCYVAKAPHSDTEARAPFAHVHTIRHGRIVRFEQYTDTKVLWDALGSSGDDST